MNEQEKLATFFDQEWEYMLQQDPMSATLLGDLRYNDRLPDFSLNAVHQRQQHERESLQKLQSIDRTALPGADQLNYDLFLRDLHENIEGHQYPDHLLPITQMSGIQQTLPSLVPLLPFQIEKHYEDYLSRLHQIPTAMEQTIDTMREGLAQKITPPQITLRDVANQIQLQATSATEESPFFEPFRQFNEMIPHEKYEELRKSGIEALEKAVFPAYRKLLSFWCDEYYPKTRQTIGLPTLPKGDAWYSYLVRASTTTNLTPEQIHEIGVNEVQRIRAEMDSVMQQTGHRGSFEEYLNFLRNDSQFYFAKPEDLLAAYRDICKRADAELPKFFGKLPRLTYGVREVPAYAAPSQTTAYYHRGSLQAARPGWFYANTYKLETRPKWEMEALSLHEAVPGHHLQIALAQEMENVPRFRNYTSYTAFIEGWGLYSESLGAEMGFYKDPHAKFGQLTYEIWRAIRLVLDTGIHAFGWDRQKAIDYFKTNAGKQEHDIIVEVDRYIVWPGQALAYKIGELKIKDLRNYATHQLAGRFDIREFHDHVLADGALPLSILEQHIRSYVGAKHFPN